MQQCLRLGLTGGIGSGKSTVAQILQTLGAHLIDADAISRQTTAPNGSAIAEIRSTFGTAFIADNGSLDRAAMRELAFSDPGARKRLEAIVHPLVGQEIEAQFQSACTTGVRCVVFDIPLLVESGYWRSRLDKVLVVDCSVATQVARVVARNHWTEEAVMHVIRAQASREQRRAVADVVILNEGLTLQELRLAVEQVAPNFGL